MPILDIEIVGESQGFPDGLAQKLADASGKALDSRPQGTWVKLSFLSPKHYAENEGMAIGFQPIIAKLVLSSIPEGEKLRSLIADLTTAISSTAGVAYEHVHIIIEPSARGRIAFGGELVE